MAPEGLPFNSEATHLIPADLHKKGGHTMRNKHPGKCYRCGETVAAGDGFFERHQGGWRVHHARCCYAARAEKAKQTPADGVQSERFNVKEEAK